MPDSNFRIGRVRPYHGSNRGGGHLSKGRLTASSKGDSGKHSTDSMQCWQNELRYQSKCILNSPIKGKTGAGHPIGRFMQCNWHCQHFEVLFPRIARTIVAARKFPRNDFALFALQRHHWTQNNGNPNGLFAAAQHRSQYARLFYAVPEFGLIAFHGQ